jgi:Flp pilus assembly protein TadG
MFTRGPVRNRQRGAAAVEFALLLPILIALSLGAIDWGYYFYVNQLVTNAAREGARAGTLQQPPPTGTQAAAQDAARQAATDFLRSVNLTGATSVSANYDNPGGTAAISVSVSYTTGGSLTGFFTGVVPSRVMGVSTIRW